MKQEDYVVAVVRTPFFCEIECENRDNTPADMKRMALMEASHRFSDQDWQPEPDEAGEPQLMVLGLTRKQRIILEDGDSPPEGMEIDEEGMGLLEEDFDEPESATITGGESVDASSEGDENADRMVAATSAIQSLMEKLRGYQSGNPPPAMEVEAALDEGSAFLEGALDSSDIDEHGQPAEEG